MDVADFACTYSKEAECYSLWAVVNESFENGSSDDVGQPYALKKCNFTNNSTALLWENVRPANYASLVDNVFFEYSNAEAVKDRILDGNNFTFEVVNRAVQVTFTH